MDKFSKKVVFITGASSGIGAALAHAFGSEGAAIVALARRAERLQSLIEDLEKKGVQALAVAGDVTREGELERAVQGALEKFGKIDVVVANAGFGVIGPISKLTLEDYRRQFETNVLGVLRTIFATLEELKKNRGELVLMGSVSGHVSTPESSPYCMSKFAIRALADSLYSELAAYGVSVVLISPGFVATEIHRVNNKGKFRPKARVRIPPWLEISAEKAAKKIVSAVAKKRREKIITFHGKFFVFLKRYFPGLLGMLFKRLSRKIRKAPMTS